MTDIYAEDWVFDEGPEPDTDLDDDLIEDDLRYEGDWR